MTEEQKVTFHYVKSSSCADIPVHGAFGGVDTQTGQFHMAVFAERRPIPQEIDVTIAKIDDGKVSFSETERRGRKGIVRSVNAVLYFDVNVGMALHSWLGERIESFKKTHPELFENEGEMKK